MDLPDGHVDALVERLARAGLVDDATGGGPAAEPCAPRRRSSTGCAPTWPRSPWSLPNRARRWHLAARRSLRVQVRGAGRVGAVLASLLAGAGWARSRCATAARSSRGTWRRAGCPPSPSATAGEEAARRAVRRAAPDRPPRRGARTPTESDDTGFSLVILAPRDGLAVHAPDPGRRRAPDHLRHTPSVRWSGGGDRGGRPARAAGRDGLRRLSGPGRGPTGTGLAPSGRAVALRRGRAGCRPAIWRWRRRSRGWPPRMRSPSWTARCPSSAGARWEVSAARASTGMRGRSGRTPHARAEPRSKGKGERTLGVRGAARDNGGATTVEGVTP